MSESFAFSVPFRQRLPEVALANPAFQGAVSVLNDVGKLIGFCVFRPNLDIHFVLSSFVADPVIFKIWGSMDFYVSLKVNGKIDLVGNTVDHIDSLSVVLSEYPIAHFSVKDNLGAPNEVAQNSLS